MTNITMRTRIEGGEWREPFTQETLNNLTDNLNNLPKKGLKQMTDYQPEEKPEDLSCNTSEDFYITKIKNYGCKVEVFYTSKEKTLERETKYTLLEAPHEDFRQAMTALIGPALDMLGLSEDYDDGVEVRGVSISQNDHQGQGCVITFLKTLENINSPFTINTPHVHEDLADQGASVMPPLMHVVLKRVIKEAEAIINGKRAQADLFKQAA